MACEQPTAISLVNTEAVVAIIVRWAARRPSLAIAGNTSQVGKEVSHGSELHAEVLGDCRCRLPDGGSPPSTIRQGAKKAHHVNGDLAGILLVNFVSDAPLPEGAGAVDQIVIGRIPRHCRAAPSCP